MDRLTVNKIIGYLLPVLVICGATSCAYDNPLLVWSDAPTTTVFFGKMVDGSGEEVNGPGFIYGPVRISWKGNKPLTLVNLLINFPAGGKLAGDYTCTVDSEDLQTLFPSIATDFIIQPGQEVPGTRLVCAGMSAKSKKDQFLISGTTKIRGFTGSATDQKFYRSESKIFLYWFPEEE